jgi:hypothetical protein
MTNRVKAWQCIGCGKVEAPQTCVGVSQDRKVEFVYVSEHEEALAQLTGGVDQCHFPAPRKREARRMMEY